MGTVDHYTLDSSGRIHPEPDFVTWGQWYATANRQIALNELNSIHVSTIFLGIDHGFGFHDQPILFETMTFGPEPWDGQQWRYATMGAALQGHHIVVKAIKHDLDPSMINIPEYQ